MPGMTCLDPGLVLLQWHSLKLKVTRAWPSINWPWADPSISLFCCINISKDALEKFMTILLRSSCETSPRISTLRKQKPLRQRTHCALSLGHVCTFPLLLSTGVYLCFLSPKLQTFPGACNQGISSSGSSSWLSLWTCLQGPSFCLCNFFLSPHSPAGSLLLHLWLSL